MSKESFEKQMEDLLRQADGTIGISIRQIGGGFSYAHQEDVLLSTASTMKLMVLGALLEKCQQGDEDLQRFIEYKKEERIGGSGILCDLTPGLRLTVRDAAVLMIVLSDNTATNMCIDLCGGVEAVNDHIRRLGVKNCSINRKLGDSSKDDASSDPLKRNLSDTSARGFVDYLTVVRTGQALNGAMTKEFFDILRLQRYKDMFGRYLPLEDYFEEEDEEPRPVLMNKTGFMLGVRTDAGILALPDGREFAYAFMLNDVQDPTYAVINKAAVLIAEAGKLFYEYIQSTSGTSQKESQATPKANGLTWTIRKARYEDLPEMLRIYATARKFMRETGNPTQWVGPDGTEKPTRETLKEDIRRGKSYVLETIAPGEKPETPSPGDERETLAAGAEPETRIWAVFYYDEGLRIEPTYARIEGAWIGDDRYGVVHRIASDGSLKGAGRICLRWAMKKSGHLRIDTHENNHPMQHVLEQLGFDYCGTIWLEDGDPRRAYEWTGKKS